MWLYPLSVPKGFNASAISAVVYIYIYTYYSSCQLDGCVFVVCELNGFLMDFLFVLNKGAVGVHKSLNISPLMTYLREYVELTRSEIHIAQYKPNYAFAKRSAHTGHRSSTQHDPTPTHPARNVFLFIKHARQIPIRFKSSPRLPSIIVMTFNFTAIWKIPKHSHASPFPKNRNVLPWRENFTPRC